VALHRGPLPHPERIDQPSLIIPAMLHPLHYLVNRRLPPIKAMAPLQPTDSLLSPRMYRPAQRAWPRLMTIRTRLICLNSCRAHNWATLTTSVTTNPPPSSSSRQTRRRSAMQLSNNSGMPRPDTNLANGRKGQCLHTSFMQRSQHSSELEGRIQSCGLTSM
jgi:hypothetical protein